MLQATEDPAIKIIVSWIGVIGVVIAALITLSGAILTALMTWWNQRASLRLQDDLVVFRANVDDYLAQKKFVFDLSLETSKQKFQQDLVAIQAGLTDENAAKQARRDYEYEARKRLYMDIEPLLFQLSERGEEALYRIAGLARWAKQGHLPKTGVGWLSDCNDYHALLNMYSLIAPLTVFKIMQRKLTAVDLALDSRINDLYTIAKAIYWSFSDHFEIQKVLGSTYDPNAADAGTMRKTQPATYWLQGLPVGILDKTAEALINEKTGQCKSFGTFEVAFKEKDSKIHQAFETVVELFRDFHPQSRPILWCILLAQANLYDTMRRNRQGKASPDGTSRSIVLLKAEDTMAGGDFDWRSPNDSAPDEEVTGQPAKIVNQYLQRTLGFLVDRVSEQTP